MATAMGPGRVAGPGGRRRAGVPVPGRCRCQCGADAKGDGIKYPWNNYFNQDLQVNAAMFTVMICK